MKETEKKELRKAVYDIVAAIPEGKVLAYGEIATLAGYPGYHRLVGRILHDVPASMNLPCHRVVNSQGRLVPGWSGQRTLLSNEGVTFMPGGNVDMKRHKWEPMELCEQEAAITPPFAESPHRHSRRRCR